MFHLAAYPAATLNLLQPSRRRGVTGHRVLHRLLVLLAVLCLADGLLVAAPPPATASSSMPFVAKVGGPPGVDDFIAPSGVASDGTSVYVADRGLNRLIKRRASDLAYLDGTGSAGSDPLQFSSPSGLATDGIYVYVADTGNHRIVVRRCADLSLVATFGSKGSGQDQFSSPVGLALGGGFLYVADAGNHRVVKLRVSDFSFVAQVGDPAWQGSGPDEFSSPRGVAVDDTYLYVADTGNRRIVKRKPLGPLLRRPDRYEGKGEGPVLLALGGGHRRHLALRCRHRQRPDREAQNV